MKSFILFAFLLIVSTCEGLNDILIIEQPKVNPNTQLYIEQFEIDMKLSVNLEDGSCSVGVWMNNNSEYIIKKIIITYEICNRINERIKDTNTGKTICKSSLIGPVLPNKGAWCIIDGVFNNYMSDHLNILSVDVEYMENDNVLDSEETIIKEIQVGDTLPSFQVVLNNNDKISTENLYGKPSVIVFFTTSCPDCRQLLPHIHRLCNSYSNDVNFLLISREENNNNILTYWNEQGLTMPYSAQEDRSIYNLFATSRIPRVYITNENNIVQYIFTDSPNIPSYDVLYESLNSVINLDVTPNNIQGTWVNKNNLNETITFTRKDREFVIQINENNYTGVYNIQTIDNKAVLLGKYDYDGGLWKHEYIINKLTTIYMELIAYDDNTIIYQLEREE